MRTTAVVLGGGGSIGTAWMAGLVNGLRKAGVDLADADLVVGTSAGSIVGACLTTGQDLDTLAHPPEGDDPVQLDRSAVEARMAEMFAVLADRSVAPDETRRRAGRLALAADTVTEQESIARFGTLVTAREWPERGRLLVTTVDTESGELVVWDRTGGAQLVSVVVASCSVPGLFPPITLNGRRYMDGGVRSGTNADLAEGADVLVVVEPLAHLMPREILQREIARVGADRVLTISPDAESVAGFGANLMDRGRWESCYQAGIRQAAGVADELRELE